MSIDPVHFTDDEILDILDATRLRSAVMRDKGPGHDRIDLLIPHTGGRSYRIERDAVGSTYLLIAAAAADDIRLLACGTLAECLDFFSPAPAL
jgi:hypothetical protein